MFSTADTARDDVHFTSSRTPLMPTARARLLASMMNSCAGCAGSAVVGDRDPLAVSTTRSDVGLRDSFSLIATMPSN